MLDFFTIATKSTKKGLIEIYPRFIIKRSKDLMIRGNDFYAIYNEDTGLWSTDEQDAISMIDNELDLFYQKNKDKFEDQVKVLHMWDAETGVIDTWHKYIQKQCRDYYNYIDKNLVFANQEVKREDYASKKLEYSLEEGPIDNWNELIGTLYSEEERFKIEWAIGSIVSGDSKKLEKFLVLYGKPGTGKGTILKVIEKLFSGYTTVFDAKSLGSSSNEFALEAFKTNPLVAIQYDGDLSHIENNARLNSLISHEKMLVNEKHKSLYSTAFLSFLLLGTNSPVKITDNKSGIIRRLIDVNPLGVKIPKEKYNALMAGIDFELGHIAYYCQKLYLNNKDAFDNYRPTTMMTESNDFFNFMQDSYIVFDEEDGVSLKSAWEMYKQYVEEAKVPFPLSMRAFRSELKTYFNNEDERKLINGIYVRTYFSGLKRNLFNKSTKKEEKQIKKENKYWLDFKEQESKLDLYCSDCLAQYGTAKETPQKKWTDVKTTLKALDTTKLHYLKVPNNLIVIDFDIKDDAGNKSYEKNLEEANKWPKTYAELSKSGGGIHLHYIYNGDVSKISSIYADNIEIKIFSGNSSLRRKLSKCTSDDISTISSGLPLKKGGGKVLNFEAVKNEKGLRTIIIKNLNKEYHPATKPSVDFIFKVLEDAYNSGMKYDVSDLRNAIFAFAAASTNQSDYCMDLVIKMHFKSDEASKSNDTPLVEKPIVFFDVEVFPNLLLINWKYQGAGIVNRMINPKPSEIGELTKHRLVGFNCRRYDNHILYGRLIGYDNQKIYELSQDIIKNHKGFFGEAYNLSYTDIYDYASKKQTLKKWEIELGIHHQELGMDWDQPVPEDKWEEVAAYCDNDVISTEAVWNATQDDFLAREILAEIAGMSVNDTTNSLTTRIIFGTNKNPVLNYVDLSIEFPGYVFEKKWNPDIRKYETHNWYRGIDLGFGGYVYAEPGMYGNVALLDVASLHPHSLISMNCFGDYTKKFKDLVDIRILVKHQQFDEAKKLFDGKLAKYFEDAENADKLSKALKIAINSVYGLTSATFANPFKDPRNENNIVALRGALFMKTLQDEVVKRGFKVAHIKTDSIKIPDATPEIINFCMEFAKQYGYTFEHEATYDRICLVNDAVYIAKYATLEKVTKLYGDSYISSSKDVCKENKKHPGTWTATGTQFQVPYVFKKCFSKENIEFSDCCETKEVKNSAIYLDMNETTQDDNMEAILEKVQKIRQKNPEDGYTRMELKLLTEYEYMSDEDIANKLDSYHNYKFIGRVGLFTPILPSKGGGLLVRSAFDKDNNIKYDSVVGTKGYRWLEAEDVINNHLENCVDESYYIALVDEAKATISQYGDYEWFVSDEEYIGENYEKNMFEDVDIFG